ncbi:MAG: anti-sigma factor antagonist [Sphingobacteriales bacterium]|nr:MAG: anti-sigma factor antagonist [Sphingobacteriales bacterium]
MTYECVLENDILFIRMDGDLIEEFRDHKLLPSLTQYIEKGVLLGAIDLSHVRYINSSGIGLLVSILTKFRNRGGEVLLINPSEHSKKLLIATKLYAIFTIADSDELAIQLLREVQLDQPEKGEQTLTQHPA